MKIIISESQLRLIVENEGKNLLDFTGHKNNPEEWDDMFEHANRKKGGKYDGYFFNGDVNLNKSDVTELKYLVKVEGNLKLYNSQIESLLMLEYVGDNLYLNDTPIESLPKLEHVGGSLFLRGTLIESLPMLKYVGSSLNLYDSLIKSLPMLKYVGCDLYLKKTPLSEMTTKKELEKQIKVKAGIYL